MPTPGAKWHQGRRRVRTAVAVALATAGGLTPEPVGRLGAHGSREGGPSGCELGRGAWRSGSRGDGGEARAAWPRVRWAGQPRQQGRSSRGEQGRTAKATGAWARRARCRAARGGVVARSTTSGGEGKRRPRASPWVAEDRATGVEEGVGDDVAKKRQAGGEEEAGRRCSSATSCSGRRRTASGGGDRRRRGGGARGSRSRSRSNRRGGVGGEWVSVGLGFG